LACPVLDAGAGDNRLRYSFCFVHPGGLDIKEFVTIYFFETQYTPLNPLFLEGTSALPSNKRGWGCVSILVSKRRPGRRIDTNFQKTDLMQESQSFW